MLTAYTGVVWDFPILSQRTRSVWPNVLVRPSWLLFWEPPLVVAVLGTTGTEIVFRDLSFGRVRLDVFARSRLGQSKCINV